jgi:hypothetical protein
MTRLFVDLLLAVTAASFQPISLFTEFRVHHSLIPYSPNSASPRSRRPCRFAAQGRILPDQRTTKLRHGVPQSRMSCHEAATPCPQLSLRCCPPLVMRNATSMIYRGRRVTDEASRSQEGEPNAGSPASSVSRLRAYGSPSVAAGSCRRLGSIPAGNLIRLDPQSKCFFAWLNCGRGMPVPAF